MKNIGFIGASGMMGHGMARNIQAKGFSLSVSVNRNRDAVADLAAAGGGGGGFAGGFGRLRCGVDLCDGVAAGGGGYARCERFIE